MSSDVNQSSGTEERLSNSFPYFAILCERLESFYFGGELNEIHTTRTITTFTATGSSAILSFAAFPTYNIG